VTTMTNGYTVELRSAALLVAASASAFGALAPSATAARAAETD
jgi:hypothetical protein